MSATSFDAIRKRYKFKEIAVATWRDPALSVHPARGGPDLQAAAAHAAPYKINYDLLPPPTDDEHSDDDDDDDDDDGSEEEPQPEDIDEIIDADAGEYKSLDDDLDTAPEHCPAPEGTANPPEPETKAHLEPTIDHIQQDDSEVLNGDEEVGEESTPAEADGNVPEQHPEAEESAPPMPSELEPISNEAPADAGPEVQISDMDAIDVTEDSSEERRVTFAPGTPEPKPTARKKKAARGARGRKKRVAIPIDSLPTDVLATIDGAFDGPPPSLAAEASADGQCPAVPDAEEEGPPPEKSNEQEPSSEDSKEEFPPGATAEEIVEEPEVGFDKAAEEEPKADSEKEAEITDAPATVNEPDTTADAAIIEPISEPVVAPAALGEAPNDDLKPEAAAPDSGVDIATVGEKLSKKKGLKTSKNKDKEKSRKKSSKSRAKETPPPPAGLGIDLGGSLDAVAEDRTDTGVPEEAAPKDESALPNHAPDGASDESGGAVEDIPGSGPKEAEPIAEAPEHAEEADGCALEVPEPKPVDVAEDPALDSKTDDETHQALEDGEPNEPATELIANDDIVSEIAVKVDAPAEQTSTAVEEHEDFNDDPWDEDVDVETPAKDDAVPGDEAPEPKDSSSANAASPADSGVELSDEAQKDLSSKTDAAPEEAEGMSEHDGESDEDDEEADKVEHEAAAADAEEAEDIAEHVQESNAEDAEDMGEEENPVPETADLDDLANEDPVEEEDISDFPVDELDDVADELPGEETAKDEAEEQEEDDEGDEEDEVDEGDAEGEGEKGSEDNHAAAESAASAETLVVEEGEDDEGAAADQQDGTDEIKDPEEAEEVVKEEEPAGEDRKDEPLFAEAEEEVEPEAEAGADAEPGAEPEADADAAAEPEPEPEAEVAAEAAVEAEEAQAEPEPEAAEVMPLEAIDEGPEARGEATEAVAEEALPVPVSEPEKAEEPQVDATPESDDAPPDPVAEAPQEPEPGAEAIPEAPPSPQLSKSSSHGSHRHKHPKAEYWTRPHAENPFKEVFENNDLLWERPHERNGKDATVRVKHRAPRSRRPSSSTEDPEERQRRRAARKLREAASAAEEEHARRIEDERRREEEERRRVEERRRRVEDEERRRARRAARKAAEEAARLEREAAAMEAEARRLRRIERAGGSREEERKPVRRDSKVAAALGLPNALRMTAGASVHGTSRPRQAEGSSRSGKESRSNREASSRKHSSPPRSRDGEGTRASEPAKKSSKSVTPPSSNGEKSHRRHRHHRRESEGGERSPASSRKEGEGGKRRPSTGEKGKEKPRSFLASLLRRS